MVEHISEEREDLKEILGDLRRPSVFVNLPLTNIQEAFLRMHAVDAKKGEVVITQGDTPDNFYILVEGEAEVWQQEFPDEDPEMVSLLTAGNHFGEDAFIMEGTRNATIKMTEDSKLLSLDGNDFKELISRPLDNQVDHGTAKIQVDQGQKELLDVRYEEEWYEVRIPGANLIPLPELRGRIDELDEGKEYIVYCHAGKRSNVAAMIMKHNGFNVSSMTGGIRDWPFAVEEGYA